MTRSFILCNHQSFEAQKKILPIVEVFWFIKGSDFNVKIFDFVSKNLVIYWLPNTASKNVDVLRRVCHGLTVRTPVSSSYGKYLKHNFDQSELFRMEMYFVYVTYVLCQLFNSYLNIFSLNVGRKEWLINIID